MRRLVFIISVFIIFTSGMTKTLAEQTYSDGKCSEWAYYYIKDAESPLYSWNFFKHNGGKTVLAAFGSDTPQEDAHTVFYELPRGSKILELPRNAGYFLNITKDEKYIITYDIKNLPSLARGAKPSMVFTTLTVWKYFHRFTVVIYRLKQRVPNI